jgi:hypothetical protein
LNQKHHRNNGAEKVGDVRVAERTHAPDILNNAYYAQESDHTQAQFTLPSEIHPQSFVVCIK